MGMAFRGRVSGGSVSSGVYPTPWSGGYFGGQYTSYWKTFLLKFILKSKEAFTNQFMRSLTKKITHSHMEINGDLLILFLCKLDGG